MRKFLARTDQFLRGTAPFAAGTPAREWFKWLIAFVLVYGIVYGAVMSSLTGLAADRWWQMAYVSIKVPLMLLVTFALCVPSFFVINIVTGLGRDVGQAVHAVVGTLACMTIVLAGLSPITAFYYVCFADYSRAVLFNGVMYAIAVVASSRVVRRYYRPLIAANSRHRTMMYFWFLPYAFVAIQMAWVLRPFIGDPSQPVAFFRQEPWSNAYLVIWQLLRGGVRGIVP
jgi:hypothetical protein